MKKSKKPVLRWGSTLLALILLMCNVMIYPVLGDDASEKEKYVYLNGEGGNDASDGKTAETAVKSYAKALELLKAAEAAKQQKQIAISGTVTVSGKETWKTAVIRAEKFEGALVNATGSLVTSGFILNAADVKGNVTADAETLKAAEEAAKKAAEEAAKKAAEEEAAKKAAEEAAKKDETATPTPTEEAKKDETVTPTPTEEAKKDETVTPTPTEEAKKDETTTSTETKQEVAEVTTPEVLTMKKAKALSTLTFSEKEFSGDGVFKWEDEKFVPDTYETTCKVIFTPKDCEKYDYSKVEGWDEATKTVIREIKVQVEALKNQKTETTDEKLEDTKTEETKTEDTKTEDTKTEDTKTEETKTEDTKTEETKTEKVEPVAEEKVEPAVEEKVESVADETVTDVEDTNVAEEAARVSQRILNISEMIENDSQVTEVVEVTREFQSLSEEAQGAVSADAILQLSKVQRAVGEYNKKSGDVTVEGTFPWYVKFEAVLKGEMQVSSDGDVDTLTIPYEFTLYDLMNDCKYVLENGQSVRVIIPIENSQDYSNMVVVHYLENGQVEYITPTIGENSISFETSSFSPFDIAGSKVLAGGGLLSMNYTSQPAQTTQTSTSTSSSSSKNTVSSSSSKTNTTTSSNKTNTTAAKSSVNTGDETNYTIYIVLAIVAIAACVAVFVFTKKKKK